MHNGRFVHFRAKLQGNVSRGIGLRQIESCCFVSQNRKYNWKFPPTFIIRPLRNAKNVDAVIELKGQKAHDFVPGAYIAIKGGAHAYDLEGKEITLESLEHLLMRPATVTSEKKYVIAATKELAMEIVNSI